MEIEKEKKKKKKKKTTKKIKDEKEKEQRTEQTGRPCEGYRTVYRSVDGVECLLIAQLQLNVAPRPPPPSWRPRSSLNGPAGRPDG